MLGDELLHLSHAAEVMVNAVGGGMVALETPSTHANQRLPHGNSVNHPLVPGLSVTEKGRVIDAGIAGAHVEVLAGPVPLDTMSTVFREDAGLL